MCQTSYDMITTGTHFLQPTTLGQNQDLCGWEWHGTRSSRFYNKKNEIIETIVCPLSFLDNPSIAC